MALVTSKEMLEAAQRGGYAVGAFNAENMEMVKAIIKAAEEVKAPVMIQTTPSTVKYASLDMFAAMVAAEAKEASVPVCLHLDHGSSFELAVNAMKAGYTSVMIDGSAKDFEGNVEVSKKVADVANALGISKTTAYTLMTSDTFPSVRIGERVIVEREKFKEWLDSEAERKSEL